MTLKIACGNILAQLKELVEQLREQDFSKPAETLSHSTIGQHLRHTLEFFGCLRSGYQLGIVNYDRRAHDHIIENDKFLALAAIEDTLIFVEQLVDNPLVLQVGYDRSEETFHQLDTTVFRELVYNIEHAVHHMAIIKIGIKELAPYVTLAADFGIAASTIRYREQNVTAAHDAI
jgi:hypothetical protein